MRFLCWSSKFFCTRILKCATNHLECFVSICFRGRYLKRENCFASFETHLRNEMKWNNKKALLIAKRLGKRQWLFVVLWKNTEQMRILWNSIRIQSIMFNSRIDDELFLNNFSKKAKTWSTTTIHLSYLNLNLLSGMIVPLLLVGFFGCHEWSAYK